MPPSAAEGSAVTGSPNPKNDDGTRSGEFADAPVSALGAALAGVEIGSTIADGVLGNGAAVTEDHRPRETSGYLGGLEWSSASNSGSESVVMNSGCGRSVHGQVRPSPRSQGTHAVVSPADAEVSFPDRLPSLMATKGSALKHQLETSFAQEQGNNNRNNNALFPPGFSSPQIQGRRGSSPPVSVVGTSASSRSASPLPSRSGYEGSTVGHGCHQPQPHSGPGRSPVAHSVRGDIPGGFAGSRTTSTGSIRPMEGGQHGQWPRVPPHSPPSYDRPQGPYAGARVFPGAPADVSVRQGAALQHATLQISDHMQPQPQQFLYMAVQTQDGRQVLQPVQMVQIPGQTGPAMVLPANSAPALVNLSGAQMGRRAVAQSQSVVLMPSVDSNGAPVDGGSRKKQGNRRPTGFSHQGQRRQHQYDSTGSVSADHRAEGSCYGYASQIVESRQQKQFSPVSAPFSHTECFPRSTRTPPHNNHRSSSRGSPTPNDVIASLYASPQRPHLKDLLGHVRRLSRDQVGCRLLQQALDEEGSEAATLILNEGLSFWGEAMVDPFGNYLFQKIAEKVTVAERITLVRSVSARLVNASLNLHGTRSVQKVVELCAADEAAEAASGRKVSESAADILTQSLATAAARLCIDSHGNHVIQRILLKLPYHQSQFVFDAVATSVGDVARHRHGCCVIQRCLDSPPSESRSHLVHCIVEKALELMQDAYGNYVVQYVLDVCGDEDVHAVCESVVGKVSLLAIQKFSSNVMEKCLERCTDRVRELYLNELSDPDKIRELLTDPFGNYVIQRALAVATHSQAVRLVEAMRPHLLSSQPGGNVSTNGGIRNTAGGRRIMAKICRRFPNFSLFEGSSPAVHHNQPSKPAAHRQHQRSLMPEMPLLQPHAQRGDFIDKHREQQSCLVDHSLPGPNAAGPVPGFSMQMERDTMMFPHSM